MKHLLVLAPILALGVGCGGSSPTGVMYPHKMVQKAGPVTMEMALDKIEPNVTIPPTAFDVPAAIDALQKK